MSVGLLAPFSLVLPLSSNL